MPNIFRASSSSSTASVDIDSAIDQLSIDISRVEGQKPQFKKAARNANKEKKILLKYIQAAEDKILDCKVAIGRHLSKLKVTWPSDDEAIIDTSKLAEGINIEDEAPIDRDAAEEKILTVGENLLGLDEKQIEQARTWTEVSGAALSGLLQLKPFFRRAKRAYAMRNLLLYYAKYGPSIFIQPLISSNQSKSSLIQPLRSNQSESPLIYITPNYPVGTMGHAIAERTERLRAVAICIADAQMPGVRACEFIQALLTKCATVSTLVTAALEAHYGAPPEYSLYIAGAFSVSWIGVGIGKLIYKKRCKQKIKSDLKDEKTTLEKSTRGEIGTVKTALNNFLQSPGPNAQAKKLTQQALQMLESRHLADPRSLRHRYKKAADKLEGIILLSPEVLERRRVKENEAKLLQKSLPHALLFLQRKVQKEFTKKREHPRYRHFLTALGINKETIKKIIELQQITLAEKKHTYKVMKEVFIGEVKRA